MKRGFPLAAILMSALLHAVLGVAVLRRDVAPPETSAVSEPVEVDLVTLAPSLEGLSLPEPVSPAVGDPERLEGEGAGAFGGAEGSLDGVPVDDEPPSPTAEGNASAPRTPEGLAAAAEAALERGPSPDALSPPRPVSPVVGTPETLEGEGTGSTAELPGDRPREDVPPPDQPAETASQADGRGVEPAAEQPRATAGEDGEPSRSEADGSRDLPRAEAGDRDLAEAPATEGPPADASPEAPDASPSAAAATEETPAADTQPAPASGALAEQPSREPAAAADGAAAVASAPAADRAAAARTAGTLSAAEPTEDAPSTDRSDIVETARTAPAELAEPAVPTVPRPRPAVPEIASVAPEEPVPPDEEAAGEPEGGEDPAASPLGNLDLDVGTGTFAAPGEGAGEGAPAAYTEAVRSAIAPGFFAAVSGIRGSGTAIVEVVIARDGTILSTDLVSSSGNPALDAASLTAALAARYPPLPPSVDRNRLTVHIPLRVR